LANFKFLPCYSSAEPNVGLADEVKLKKMCPYEQHAGTCCRCRRLVHFGSAVLPRKSSQFLTNLEYGLAQGPVWALWRKDGILVCSGNRTVIHGTSRPYLLTTSRRVLHRETNGF